MRFIPPDFDPVLFALEQAPSLTPAERDELEQNEWAELYERGEEIAEQWRTEAGTLLEALGQELVDPQRAALRAQGLTAQAELAGQLVIVARDDRFEELPVELQRAARALAVRSLVRAVVLEVTEGEAAGGGPPDAQPPPATP